MQNSDMQFQTCKWKKIKQLNKQTTSPQKSILSFSRQTTSKYTLTSHSPSPSFPSSVQLFKKNFEAVDLGSPPVSYPFLIFYLQALDIPSFNTTIYRVSKNSLLLGFLIFTLIPQLSSTRHTHSMVQVWLSRSSESSCTSSLILCVESWRGGASGRTQSPRDTTLRKE